MRKELQIKNKEKYIEVVEWFKREINSDVDVKLSPFKHKRMVAYYNWKTHKMVIFVPNTKGDTNFVQTVAHEMAHVVDLQSKKGKAKWSNHHDIRFFIEYYRLLEMYFGELPLAVWVEFLEELETYNISHANFNYYNNIARRKRLCECLEEEGA